MKRYSFDESLIRRDGGGKFTEKHRSESGAVLTSLTRASEEMTPAQKRAELRQQIDDQKRRLQNMERVNGLLDSHDLYDDLRQNGVASIEVEATESSNRYLISNPLDREGNMVDIETADDANDTLQDSGISFNALREAGVETSYGAVILDTTKDPGGVCRDQLYRDLDQLVH